jgi:putative amide transporter protein
VADVGLLYVGAVLFINGIASLGWMTAREAAPLNLFVGGLQVLTPTVLLIMEMPDDRSVFAASGLYLFGFTYLWVGWHGLVGGSNRGLGWFSLFVAICAVVYSIDSFVNDDDPAFGVIWLVWAVLWLLFFLILALGREQLTAPTGVFTVVVAFVTAAVPAFLLLLGHWSGSWSKAAAIAVLSTASLILARPVASRVAAAGRGGRSSPSSLTS